MADSFEDIIDMLYKALELGQQEQDRRDALRTRCEATSHAWRTIFIDGEPTRYRACTICHTTEQFTGIQG